MGDAERALRKDESEAVEPPVPSPQSSWDETPLSAPSDLGESASSSWTPPRDISADAFIGVAMSVESDASVAAPVPQGAPAATDGGRDETLEAQSVSESPVKRDGYEVMEGVEVDMASVLVDVDSSEPTPPIPPSCAANLTASQMYDMRERDKKSNTKSWDNCGEQANLYDLSGVDFYIQ